MYNVCDDYLSRGDLDGAAGAAVGEVPDDVFAELVSLGAAPGGGEATSVGAGSVDHALGTR